MKIKTVCEITGLSDRTIRYYIEQQLVAPSFTENYLGRKSYSFSNEIVERLKHIAILRHYDFTIEEIRNIITNCQNSISVIANVKARTEKAVRDIETCKNILSQIRDNRIYTLEELALELSKEPEGLSLVEEKVNVPFLKRLLNFIAVVLRLALVWSPIATVAFLVLVTLMLYAYPSFYGRSLIYLALLIVPSVSVMLIGRTKRKEKKWVQPILLGLCAVCVFIGGFVLMVLPAGSLGKSETTDITNYRDLDANCLANRDQFFQEMFPMWPNYFENEEQPDGSFETKYLNASYYYRYIYSFDYTYDVYAEWPLDKEAFDKEVDRVTDLFEKYSYDVVQKGVYTCLVLWEGHKLFQEEIDNYSYYIFAYDEDNLVVRYICCCSLENGVDQPYYLELEW